MRGRGLADSKDLELAETISSTTQREDNPRPTNREPINTENPRDRYLKLIFCFVGLQISYILWGITQENLMTTEYKLGKFKSSSFCVFANRLLALIISFTIVATRSFYQTQHQHQHGAGDPKQKVIKDVPFYYYAPSSLSNTISSWAQYEALKYISFPIQVLSKSCKIIPVMLVGILINRKNYPLSEYIEATLITIGVATFTFGEKSGNAASHKHISEPEDDSYLFYGVFLLGTYLLADSFTSQWQSKVYKQFGIDQYQMMLGVNIWSMLMTFITLLQSGEFFSSIAFLTADSSALLNMVVLSITSATGQLFIFYTIKELGPVMFTIFMTTRQLFSLFLSCLLFGHSLSWISFFAAFFVFCIVFKRIYLKGTD